MKKTAKAASNPEVNQYLKEAGILPSNESLGPIGPNDQWVALKKDMVTAAIKAGVKPLANLISAMPVTSLPSDVREAWEQLQSAKQFRYPSGTINNLWKIFEKLARKRGINPMSVTAKKADSAHWLQETQSMMNHASRTLAEEGMASYSAQIDNLLQKVIDLTRKSEKYKKEMAKRAK